MLATVAKTPRIHLPTASARIGILTLERARIAVEGGTVVAHTGDVVLALPTHTLTALFLGPGTTLTHRAAADLADAGVTVVWTGSGAVRAYSTVTPLAVRAQLLHRQVSAWADRQQRLTVARRLYALRFPDDAAAQLLTMEELRSAEGRRVRDRYRDAAAEHGLTWVRRDTDWDRSDDLNRAITTAYQALYGAALAAIQALGLHPGLGFIHTGNAHAFSYDIADLHKTELGLDTAVAAYLNTAPGGVERATRRAMNHAMAQNHTVAAMIGALHRLFAGEDADVFNLTVDDLELFDLRGNVPANTNYADTVDVPF